MAAAELRANNSEFLIVTRRRSLHMITISLMSALCVALSIGLAAVLRPVGLLRILRLQFTYSTQQFVTIYGSWSDLQKQRFSQHFWVDYPFMLCYGLLGYLIATHFASSGIDRRMPPWSVLILPFAATVDAIEDVSQQAVIKAFLNGRAANWQALLSGACATTKWLLIGLFLVLVAAR